MSTPNNPVQLEWWWDGGGVTWDLVVVSAPTPYTVGEAMGNGSWELWTMGDEDDMIDAGTSPGGFRTAVQALRAAASRHFPHVKVPAPPIMTKGGEQVARKETFEKLADLEHRQWAHWVTYMLDLYEKRPHTEWLEQVKKWRDQADTPYSDLQEFEKDSDRDWALQVLEIIADD